MISLTSFNLFISNFHFVRPFWLLAIFALLLVLWRLKKHRFYQSPWQHFLPNHLSKVLVEGSSSTHSNKKSTTEYTFLLKPFIIGLLSIIALAGPVWQKLPQPVYQTERGSVLIMDMSYSMYATDIKPNRLTRSRFKAIDLLNKINEGDTGLIAYAEDAFVISPLTQDTKNITLLLPSLTPEIMPLPGANPIAALTLAHEMLINAGHLNGDIYWFTDDVDNQEINDIYEWSTNFGHQLNILGVGSESGAPITLPSGELLKDSSGAIVVPRLPSQRLMSLASRGNGNYQTIKNDDSDINNLIVNDKIREKNKNERQQSQQTGDQWQEQGAWLLVLVLPLMLGYFRRGSMLLILPLGYIPLLFALSFSLVSPTSFAAESNVASSQQSVQQSNQQSVQQENIPNIAAPSTTETLKNTSKKIWQSLWQTNDQQAQAQYNQGHYQDAAEQFESSQWQGSAHYKAGNYEAALEAFKTGEHANTANALYNQGNALAQMKEYEQAIESYEKALNKNPELQDAKDNIEKIKQQQKEQEKNKDQQQGDESKEDQSQNKKDQEQSDQDSQPQNQDQDQQSQDKQSKDQQNQQNQQKSDDSQNQKKDSADEQQENDKQEENESQDSSKKQNDEDAKKKEQEQQEQKSAEQAEKQDKQDEEKTAAQLAAEQQAKEAEQKYQQLLNKVTDDPYLLLRNKMQLEYQKRKQNGASQGVKKQW